MVYWWISAANYWNWRTLISDMLNLEDSKYGVFFPSTICDGGVDSSWRMTRQSTFGRILIFINIAGSSSSRHFVASIGPILLNLGSLGSSTRKLVADADLEAFVPSVEASVSTATRDRGEKLVQKILSEVEADMGIRNSNPNKYRYRRRINVLMRLQERR